MSSSSPRSVTTRMQLVFCYGGYERAFLKRMRKVAKSQDQVDRVLNALVNVLSLVYAHVYFPCYSNSLKDVGNYLGCRWTEPDASGIQSIVWRRTWENTDDGEWKQRLLTYNLEDCVALKKVIAFLYTLQSDVILSGNQDGEDSKVPQVATVEDIKPPSTRRTWCKAEYFIPEFAEINDCAYFDYQRDKVYVRTSRILARVSRRRKRRKRRGNSGSTSGSNSPSTSAPIASRSNSSRAMGEFARRCCTT